MAYISRETSREYLADHINGGWRGHRIVSGSADRHLKRACRPGSIHLSRRFSAISSLRAASFDVDQLDWCFHTPRPLQRDLSPERELNIIWTRLSAEVARGVNGRERVDGREAFPFLFATKEAAYGRLNQAASR